MIITRTPYRVSFLGGGTDYPEWLAEEEGAVLSTTIDKYCYITCQYLPSFSDVKHRVVWRHVETVGSLADILHPAVRECLPWLGFDDSQGLEIHYLGDLPARSGVGSSSSFAVGLIHALSALRKEPTDRNTLARQAIEFEQGILREHVGSQDQIAAAYGGFNAIRFANGGFAVEPIPTLLELQSHLMLFYIGAGRHASKIAASIVENIPLKKHDLRKLCIMVDEGIDILKQGDISDFGRLLHNAWMLKRELSPLVTNPTVDAVYATARKNGALGGKLLGAGNSGFMLLFVPPDNQQRIKDALPYLQVPFCFESEGSKILYGV